MSIRFRVAIAVVMIIFTSCQKQLHQGLHSIWADSLLISGDSAYSPLGVLVWWTHPTDIPSPSYYEYHHGAEHQQGFTINGKGYVVGGTYDFRSAEYWSNLDEYDPSTNGWTAKSGYPGPENVTSCNFVIGTRAYMMVDNDCWCYDQLTDTWTQKASIPAFYYLRHNGSAFAIKGKGYVGLGLDYEGTTWNYLKDWWEYDPEADKWIPKKDFAGTPRNQAPAFAVGDYGYVCSGGGNNELWQYNPARDSWTRKADAPTAGLTNGIGLSGVVDGGIPLGFVVQGIPKGCLQYNPTTDRWTLLPDMPGIPDIAGGARSNFTGFMIGRSLYVAGGNIGPDTFESSEFDVDALNWSR